VAQVVDNLLSVRPPSSNPSSAKKKKKKDKINHGVGATT
jgi:hypothetical protein